MCPLRYIYHILLFLLSNALLSSHCVEWKAQFDPSEITIKTGTKQRIHLVLSGLSDEAIANLDNRDYIQLRSENNKLATVNDQKNLKFFEIDRAARSWDANFDVTGVFLGKSSVCAIPP